MPKNNKNNLLLKLNYNLISVGQESWLHVL